MHVSERMRLPLALAALLAAVVLAFRVQAASADGPLWVNDLAYGSAGGGFYWDPVSGQVWTGERGWHLFSPAPPRQAAPLWVNHLMYGSRGGGFYWDPLSGQVWTAERGWHLYSPGAAPVPPTPAPSPSPAPGTPRVGDVTESQGSWYRVNGITDNYPGGVFKPDAGNRYFAFDVTQAATVNDDPYNIYYFEVQTAELFVYDCSGLGSPEPSFGSGHLLMGQRVRGWASCELPANAKVTAIFAQPSPLGAKIVIADLTKGTTAVSAYPAAPKPAGPAVGATTESGGSRYTVNSINPNYTGSVFKPDQGFRYYAIDITQVATKQDDPYNVLYFHVQTSDDYFWDCWGFGAPSPAFSSGRLNAGQAVRGWASCEIPQNATVVAIFADPEPLGASIIIAVP